jgi:hypothetical protein
MDPLEHAVDEELERVWLTVKPLAAQQLRDTLKQRTGRAAERPSAHDATAAVALAAQEATSATERH